MSVNYSTRLGYGFIVHKDKLDALYQKGGEELLSEFQENDYALAVDGWRPDTSDYFFGLVKYSLDPGEVASVPNVRNIPHEKFREMMDEYKHFFPDEKCYVPHDFILSCID